MKKIVIAVTMILSIFVLVGCSGQQAVSNSTPETTYEDGTYRGIFADRGDIQVSVEFKLEDNKVTEINFRQLYHGGTDYRTEKEDAVIIGLREQHEELINHLVEKDIRVSLKDLYTPENIITNDVDTFTGATVRAGKVISATRDALNRGVYKY